MQEIDGQLLRYATLGDAAAVSRLKLVQNRQVHSEGRQIHYFFDIRQETLFRFCHVAVGLKAGRRRIFAAGSPGAILLLIFVDFLRLFFVVNVGGADISVRYGEEPEMQEKLLSIS